ncbi:MAG: hypothetical protein P1V36_00175 [Planctomycetota bacterium]|nr:hypothetical protein [Planctomycetota bacterium]
MSKKLIRQGEVYPASGIPWAQGVYAVAGEALSQYDIVVLNAGVAGRDIATCNKADADGVGLQAGQMYIAAGAAAAGERVTLVPWVTITGVDTSAVAAAGLPVYLSTTPGGWTATKPSGADDVVIPVGTALVDDAAGVVRLQPTNGLDGLSKRGTAAVVTAGVTVSLGNNFASGLAVVSWAEDPGSDQSLFVAIDSSGDMVITPTAAVTGSKTCNYVAYAAAI